MERKLAAGGMGSVYLAEDLNLRIGSGLTIHDHDFVVVGVRERVPRDLGELNYSAHITLDALARVLGRPDPFNRITALVAPGHDDQEVARAIEADYLEWDVGDLVERYVRTIAETQGRPLSWERDDIALQNIQARVRARCAARASSAGDTRRRRTSSGGKIP